MARADLVSVNDGVMVWRFACLALRKLCGCGAKHNASNSSTARWDVVIKPGRVSLMICCLERLDVCTKKSRREDWKESKQSQYC
jgi:hypothetical protein